jgi:FtsP/CotA-like multicopper oxidase with cupredoxin domain
VKRSVIYLFLIASLVLTINPRGAIAGSGSCPRFAAGSTVRNPPALYSRDGTLIVNFSYNSQEDAQGRTLYCFTTPDGTESPTLHVHPGDHLVINVKNNLPTPADSSEMAMATNAADVCGAATMNSASVNIHYHGTNTSPTCHSDEVVHTLINPGETFRYDVAFPFDEPSGLYWYHPHVHGLSEHAVQGGGTGAIVVDGIEVLQPLVAHMPQRVLVIRDQEVAGNPMPGGQVPSWDVTLNYVPIPYPALTPAIIKTKPNEQQFWRVVNASADTILDLKLLYDDVPQPIILVALDGVPIGSQDGTARGHLIPVTHLRLPPAARMEFIARSPSRSVKRAQFVTSQVNTGPDGDNDPTRVLANIEPVGDVIGPDSSVVRTRMKPWRQRFEGMREVRITAKRRLYFSENETQFFITVVGQKPVAFSPNNPPAITTTQGSVEEWTIQNRTQENHEFHIHQTHFMLLSQNNFLINGSRPIPALENQFLDMVDVPFWDGNPRHPYPSVTVLIDFRGQDIGDFVYHCHILEHEDGGMMAIIRVLPGPAAKRVPKEKNSPVKASRRETPFVKVALRDSVAASK